MKNILTSDPDTIELGKLVFGYAVEKKLPPLDLCKALVTIQLFAMAQAQNGDMDKAIKGVEQAVDCAIGEARVEAIRQSILEQQRV